MHEVEPVDTWYLTAAHGIQLDDAGAPVVVR